MCDVRRESVTLQISETTSTAWYEYKYDNIGIYVMVPILSTALTAEGSALFVLY